MKKLLSIVVFLTLPLAVFSQGGPGPIFVPGRGGGSSTATNYKFNASQFLPNNITNIALKDGVKTTNINNAQSFIGGGGGNVIVGGSTAAYIVGGTQNTNSSIGDGVITGGGNNQQDGSDAFIGSGTYNWVAYQGAAIVAGTYNYNDGDEGFIGAGFNNFITNNAQGAAILGGLYNYVNANGGMAIGSRITNSSNYSVSIGYSGKATRFYSNGVVLLTSNLQFSTSGENLVGTGTAIDATAGGIHLFRLTSSGLINDSSILLGWGSGLSGNNTPDVNFYRNSAGLVQVGTSVQTPAGNLGVSNFYAGGTIYGSNGANFQGTTPGSIALQATNTTGATRLTIDKDWGASNNITLSITNPVAGQALVIRGVSGNNFNLTNETQSGGIATNANQFGANTTLTIKDAALTTNITVYSNLTVAYSSLPAVNINSSGTGGRNYSLISGDTANAAIAGSLAFIDQTANVVRMELNSSGELGIGSTQQVAFVSISNSIAADVVIRADSSGTNFLQTWAANGGIVQASLTTNGILTASNFVANTTGTTNSFGSTLFTDVINAPTNVAAHTTIAPSALNSITIGKGWTNNLNARADIVISVKYVDAATGDPKLAFTNSITGEAWTNTVAFGITGTYQELVIIPDISPNDRGSFTDLSGTGASVTFLGAWWKLK